MVELQMLLDQKVFSVPYSAGQKMEHWLFANTDNKVPH